MRVMVLSAAALAAVCSTPAAGSVITLGSSRAHSCYEAANARSPNVRTFEDCTSALALDPLSKHDRVGTYVNRGILFMLARNEAAADRDFDAAIRLDQEEPEAWLNKAISSLNKGRMDEAIPMANRALALRTRKPALAHFVRGLANEELGNVQAAYRDLNRAQTLEPGWDLPALELARYRKR